MLRGRIVNLRAIEPSDFMLIHKWANEPDSMIYWGRPGQTVSLAEVAQREQIEASRGNSRKYIVETTDAVAIGHIDYYDADWQVRSAYTSILIGESQYLGSGYGTDAMRTLLDYLFRQVGLHRVALNVHASNVRAQRSYSKNGFRSEGVMRDWGFFDGKWVDGILMSVLESDFISLHTATAD